MAIERKGRLLFLPGAGGSADFWRSVGDRLTGWDKVYLSWPGLGAQPPDPAVNSWEDLVALAEARLGPQDNVLIAQSMGGYVALRLALKRPALVGKLVLTVTSGGVDAALKARAEHDWRPEFREAFPHSAQWILEPWEDLTGRLGEVACPSLLLYGAADRIAPPFVGQRLAELLPNAELIVLPDADHDLALTHAERVSARIREFL